MKLYHWYSQVLAAYSQGDIIVMAENVEKARDKVYEQFNPLQEDGPFEDSYLICLYQMNDEDYLDEHMKKLMELRTDLDKEPTVLESGTAFIRGSD